MLNHHSPTTTSLLWAVFLAPIHAKTVHAMQIVESSGEWDVLTVASVLLLVVGLILIVGSFFWQKKIDKDKRKW